MLLQIFNIYSTTASEFLFNENPFDFHLQETQEEMCNHGWMHSLHELLHIDDVSFAKDWALKNSI